MPDCGLFDAGELYPDDVLLMHAKGLNQVSDMYQVWSQESTRVISSCPVSCSLTGSKSSSVGNVIGLRAPTTSPRKTYPG